MKNNESKEMYLETIYILEESHGHAHVAEIASLLKVTKPSVTKAMKSLKEDEMIFKEKYGSITLTDKGKKLAKKVYDKHRIISKYIMHSLGLSSKEAAINACKMEHVVTDEMIVAIKQYLKNHEID